MISNELKNKYKFKKSLKGLKSKYIVCVGKFNNYLECSSPEEIIGIAKQYGTNNCVCEVNINNTHLCCYFDYDHKDNLLSHKE